MKAALGLARAHGTLTRADFALDNEAVVKQCSTLLNWSSLRWLKCSDRDVWRCLAEEMRRLAGAGVVATVRWIRSHPEGRCAHAAWARDDVANHLADRWTNKAQSLPQSALTHDVAGTWDVAYCGDTVTGPLRKTLKATLIERHLKMGLQAAGRAPAHADMDWTLIRRCMVGMRKEGLGMLVWWTKALGNILAAETVLTRRGRGVAAGGDAVMCKLCGEAPETGWVAFHCQFGYLGNQMLKGPTHPPLGIFLLLFLATCCYS